MRFAITRGAIVRSAITLALMITCQANAETGSNIPSNIHHDKRACNREVLREYYQRRNGAATALGGVLGGALGALAGEALSDSQRKDDWSLWSLDRRIRDCLVAKGWTKAAGRWVRIETSKNEP